MEARKLLKLLIAILFLIFTAFAVKIVNDLNILPFKYILIIGGILLVLNLIADILLLIKGRLGLKLVGLLIYLILETAFIAILYYGNATHKFLEVSFDNASETYQVGYYIISKNEHSRDDLKTQDIFYHLDLSNKVDILNKLASEEIKTFIEIDDINELLTKDLVLIEKPTFSNLSESITTFKPSDYKIIYEINIDIKLSNEAIGEEELDEEQKVMYEKLTPGEYYNIFIGGYDFTNTYMDFNMLVSINKTNSEILITSIPRDFYLVDTKIGRRDRLSAMGSRGIEANMGAVAKMFGVKIDYYIQINTNSLVALVDAVGGITYCSDQAFTTSHALILGSYDDTQGEKFEVKKGCQSLNGIETLTVARERVAFKTGDIQRQKNCVQIMQAIFNKMKSPSIATKYTSILGAVNGFYTTTIPKELVTSSIQDLLANGNWKIQNQSVTGSHGEDYIYTEHVMGYVMRPNTSSVNSAKYKIQGLKYHKLSEL